VPRLYIEIFDWRILPINPQYAANASPSTIFISAAARMNMQAVSTGAPSERW